MPQTRKPETDALHQRPPPFGHLHLRSRQSNKYSLRWLFGLTFKERFRCRSMRIWDWSTDQIGQVFWFCRWMVWLLFKFFLRQHVQPGINIFVESQLSGEEDLHRSVSCFHLGRIICAIRHHLRNTREIFPRFYCNALMMTTRWWNIKLVPHESSTPLTEDATNAYSCLSVRVSKRWINILQS